MSNIGRLLIRCSLAAMLTGTVTLTAGASSAYACSCMAYTDAEAFEAADAVFVGRLVDVREPLVMLASTDDTRYVFEVDSVYRGRVHRTQSVVTAADGASCGFELDGSGPFLVFANGRGDDSGELTSGRCSGTRSIGRAEVPAEFGPGIAADEGSSRIGRDESGLAIVTLAVVVVVSVIGAAGYGVVAASRRRQRR